MQTLAKPFRIYVADRESGLLLRTGRAVATVAEAARLAAALSIDAALAEIRNEALPYSHRRRLVGIFRKGRPVIDLSILDELAFSTPASKESLPPTPPTPPVPPKRVLIRVPAVRKVEAKAEVSNKPAAEAVVRPESKGNAIPPEHLPKAVEALQARFTPRSNI